ncbi:hypothetical protein JWE21_29445, partial [Klebsiella pneumoniae]|nr:hypothetical protein [Klebsiella pneumoniae]
LGGGISGDSVILGGGGYAGSEMQKTTRSSVFAPPDEVTAEPEDNFPFKRVKSLFNNFFYRARKDKNRSCPAKASNYGKTMN